MNPHEVEQRLRYRQSYLSNDSPEAELVGDVLHLLLLFVGWLVVWPLTTALKFLTGHHVHVRSIKEGDSDQKQEKRSCDPTVHPVQLHVGGLHDLSTLSVLFLYKLMLALHVLPVQQYVLVLLIVRLLEDLFGLS